MTSLVGVNKDKIAERYILSLKPVLYLPFSQMGLGRVSKDAYGRLCTYTGATWTPAGYNFTANSDIINAGSTDYIGTSAVTIFAWITPLGTLGGSSGVGKILSTLSTKLNFGIVLATTNLSFTSDNVTFALSAANSLALNRICAVAVTRDSTGLANFFVNGFSSGSLNQNSGTVGTGSNVSVGNRSAANAASYGVINDMIVIKRVLSLLEIQNLMFVTKHRNK